MARSYSLYDMAAFPEDKATIEASYQLSLLGDAEKPPLTRFELQRTTADGEVDVYRVLYERHYEQVGRALNVEFTSFTATYHFPAYYIREDHLLVLKARADLARGAMRQLIAGGTEVRGDYRRLDLASIRPRIPSFKGAWFDLDGSAHVSSQALFGSSVDEDTRFDQALSEGGINFARFEYKFRGEFHHVGITKDYRIVLYDDNLDEELELALIRDIKENLLSFAKAL